MWHRDEKKKRQCSCAPISSTHRELLPPQHNLQVLEFFFGCCRWLFTKEQRHSAISFSGAWTELLFLGCFPFCTFNFHTRAVAQRVFQAGNALALYHHQITIAKANIIIKFDPSELSRPSSGRVLFLTALIRTKLHPRWAWPKWFLIPGNRKQDLNCKCGFHTNNKCLISSLLTFRVRELNSFTPALHRLPNQRLNVSMCLWWWWHTEEILSRVLDEGFLFNRREII